MRLFLAFRAFFVVLFDRQRAEAIRQVLAGDSTSVTISEPAAPQGTPRPAAASKVQRNDAITLLATLQREARLVDIVKEPLHEYSDAQVGAAARDVLRDCGVVLDRLFALQPVLEQPEGTMVELPAEIDAGRYRIAAAGNLEGAQQGSLVHHGWQAAHCNLPQWNGSPDSAMVVAPAELEVK
jgi:hypothetical protein